MAFIYILLIIIAIGVWKIIENQNKIMEKRKIENHPDKMCELDVNIEGLNSNKNNQFQTDSDSIMDGEKITRHKNGSIGTQEQYKNGKLEGLRKEYFDTGELWCKENYKDGKRHGSQKLFYKNGSLQRDWTYKHGEWEGILKEYHENGNLRYESGEYVDGKQNGIERFFYEEGSLRSKTMYKNNEPVEVAETYYPSGKIMSETDYRNAPRKTTKVYYESGKIKSEFSEFSQLDTPEQVIEEDGTEYYESGKVRSVYTFRFNWKSEHNQEVVKEVGSKKGYYESGKIEYEETLGEHGKELLSKRRFLEIGKPYEGAFTVKDGDGNVIAEENYKNGQLDGLVKFYSIEGALEEEANFRGGLRNGKTKKYDSDGRLEYDINYKDGKKIEETNFSYSFLDNDNKIKWERYENFETNENCDKEYYDSGNIKQKNYSEGDKYVSIDYYESGQIESESISENNQWRYKYYWKNGKLKSEENRGKELRMHGICKSYYKDGNIKSEGNYVHGSLHGMLKQYDPEGKMIAEIKYEDNEQISEKIYDRKAKEKFDCYEYENF